MKKFDKKAFFILPFGKKDVDIVWKNIYEPVANDLGFEAVRIDERDDGRFKIDQIINEISTADLIICDLTYERPNCYFELGYARARREKEEIILCSREDHVDQSNYRPRCLRFNWKPFSVFFELFPKNIPPRIHFDSLGYGVNTWNIELLEEFKVKFNKGLSERIIQKRTSFSSIPSGGSKTAIHVDSEKTNQLEEFRKRANHED